MQYFAVFCSTAESFDAVQPLSVILRALSIVLELLNVVI